MGSRSRELHISHDLEFPDIVFSRLHDAIDAVVVARVSVADIFLEEFAHDAFSHALRARVLELLKARTTLDAAACAYCEVGGLRAEEAHDGRAGSDIQAP